MKPFYAAVLSFVLLSATAGAQQCQDGWMAYKDDRCIKVFTTSLLTYDEANAFCSSQGSELSKGSLVMVKEAELQELLSNTTNGIVDNIWLGGRFYPLLDQFYWEDGEPLNYSNWQAGYPRNTTGQDACIEMKPLNANKLSVNAGGEWAHVNCLKHNLVMCQTTLTWSLKDAVAEIIKMQKQIENATNERNELRAELQVVSSRVVPLGSIYIEYFNQSSPTTLWPNLSWEDISESYAGLFFRVHGGNSSSWGDIQAGCAPRITQMNFDWLTHDADFPRPGPIRENGWSEPGRAGYYYYQQGQLSREGLSFYTEGCEVRPVNQAIRIWKRTG